LTTAAEHLIKTAELQTDGEAGQSLLEFLLMFPMLLALVIVLIRVNTAIQISIVNQQYARAQTFVLTSNAASRGHGCIEITAAVGLRRGLGYIPRVITALARSSIPPTSTVVSCVAM
jgi:hypothetical protein